MQLIVRSQVNSYSQPMEYVARAQRKSARSLEIPLLTIKSRHTLPCHTIPYCEIPRSLVNWICSRSFTPPLIKVIAKEFVCNPSSDAADGLVASY